MERLLILLGGRKSRQFNRVYGGQKPMVRYALQSDNLIAMRYNDINGF